MHPITILLVDDHEILRKGLRALLDERRPFMEVIGETGNGRSAVELAKQLRPRIVLMDISLPGLNGVDTTRKIVSECPGVRVLALSMHAEKHFIVEMFRAGASGYLLKDCSCDELVQAIGAVGSGASHVSGCIAGFLQTEPAVDDVSWSLFSVFSLLSPREREVLQLLAEGKSTREIAGCLGIGEKTVETHRQHLMKKLDIHNVPQLTKYALKAALTPLEA